MIGTRAAVGLVARREIVERVRERSLLISTFVTVGILAAALVLPSALGFGGPAKGTIAAAGPQALAVANQARAQEKAFDVDLTVRRVAGDAAARALVRDGEADVAILADGRALAVADQADEAVVAAVQAGSSTVRGARLPPPLPVQRFGDGDSDAQQGIAFVALVILYGQLLGYGFWVATGVVEEKSTRVVELLLSTIRPRELLAGKVIGIGLLGLAQLLLIGAAGVAIGAATGQLEVNADVLAAVGIVLAWFVLGFLFYSCAFAVAGALVPRQEELQTATAPLTILIVMSFFLSFGALDDPGSSLARTMSFVPPSAPMVMPVRLIAGEAAAWEVVASVALTVLGGAALIAVAARVYGAAVLRTGARVSLRTVWRATGRQPAGRR
ncbi:MAG: type transport system permease protein [Solirubrobacteraceae bacterium]|nr:type transport system permease protein [Solirubrobacteraceae bacterium]